MTEPSSHQSDEPVPVQPVLDYASPRARSEIMPSGPIPPALRWAGYVAGVALPVVCFAWSVHGYPLGPEWQSGQIQDYAKLFMHGRVSWPFFPLLAVCAACMALACHDPVRYGGRWWVRLGVYAGVLLAAQFCLFVAVGSSDGTVAGLARPVLFGAVVMLVAAGITWGVNLACWRFSPRPVRYTLLAIALGLAVAYPVGLTVGIVMVATAPALTLATYLAVSVALWRYAATDQAARRGPGWWGEFVAGGIGSGAYVGAWAMAVRQAIRMYQTLPVNPPAKCYVASAAAGGHRRFVRSRVVDGVPINDQLRRLKCAEIALATLAPSCHRAVRRAYDRLGPALAARVTHPLLADLAYATLKPAEWACVFVLRRLLGDFDTLAAAVYCGAGTAPADETRMN